MEAVPRVLPVPRAMTRAECETVMRAHWGWRRADDSYFIPCPPGPARGGVRMRVRPYPVRVGRGAELVRRAVRGTGEE